MRVKTIIENVLRVYPPAFRLGSKVYHALNSSFRSASPEAPVAVERAIEAAKQLRGQNPGDYYEFGLFRGFTFLTAFNAATQLGLAKMRFHGFDSFEGLPELEDDDIGDGQFFKGQFACSEASVRSNLSDAGMDLGRAQFIKGYYENSLTEKLRAEAAHPFGPAAVVMLDCDLYSSTRDALQWLRPYLSDKTILIFDDWYSYGGGTEQGQPKAMQEYLDANPNLRVEQLFDYKHHGSVFALQAT